MDCAGQCPHRRFINEIVIGEECDETPWGVASHFELYSDAMSEIGASTERIDCFVQLIRTGVPTADALVMVEAPAPIQQFVKATIDVCTQADAHCVLGNFFYGRENVIPSMFSSLLSNWKIDSSTVPKLAYYLSRHIDLDSGQHGPVAESALQDLVDADEAKLRQAFEAGLAAIEERMRLWDGLHAALADRSRDALTLARA